MKHLFAFLIILNTTISAVADEVSPGGYKIDEKLYLEVSAEACPAFSGRFYTDDDGMSWCEVIKTSELTVTATTIEAKLYFTTSNGQNIHSCEFTYNKNNHAVVGNKKNPINSAPTAVSETCDKVAVWKWDDGSTNLTLAGSAVVANDPCRKICSGSDGKNGFSSR